MQTAKHEEKEYRKRFDPGVWKKVFRLLRPYRRNYARIMGAMFLLAGVEVLFPLVTRFAIDQGIVPGESRPIYLAVTAYLILIMLQALLVRVFINGCGQVGARVMRDLRSRTFDHLQTLSISYFDKTPVGWLMSRLMSDSQRLGETLTWGAVDFVWGFVMMALMAITMLIVHPSLALAVIGLIPVLIMISVKFQGLILGGYRSIRKLNSEITAGYNEGISGVAVIKSLGQERTVAGEFGRMTKEMFETSLKTAISAALYLPIVHVIGVVGTALVVSFGGHGVLAGGITIGTLVAFISYTRRFFDPANEIARVFGQLQETQASAERLFTLLETKPEIVDHNDALDHGRMRGAVEFHNVSFSYTGKQNVLEHFSLKVEPGQTIALVGPTGGGKSTIINLLARMYEPDHGTLLLDGVDYRQRTRRWLRSQLGVVLQTPHLFTGTIRENIRYGRLQAGSEEIRRAARMVGVDDFISALPDGYETILKEGGAPLSTGQKQLVSFARAVLADPAIFIMDEATSSVDTETEFRIQQATQKLLAGRTSFIIAHRLTTIRRADRIIVIEKGVITESGTHAQLLSRRGHYCELYRRQFMGLKMETAV